MDTTFENQVYLPIEDDGEYCFNGTLYKVDGDEYSRTVYSNNDCNGTVYLTQQLLVDSCIELENAFVTNDTYGSQSYTFTIMTGDSDDVGKHRMMPLQIYIFAMAVLSLVLSYAI